MSYHLVTTALEQTWKFDRKVLFLGEHCCLYSRKHIWENMDAIVASPFGTESEHRKKILAYINPLVEELLVELSATLNSIHKANYSLRFWRIVIYHWLYRYVSVLYNRYHTIENALNNYDISATTVLNLPDFNLQKNDSLQFIYACNDDLWNHNLYSKILDFLGHQKIEINQASLGENSNQLQSNQSLLKFNYNLKNLIRNFIRIFLRLFVKKNDAFIVNSYLPFLQEFLLQIKIGQVPQLWISPKAPEECVNSNMRSNFLLNYENHVGFERFLRIHLSDILPICYLEGFNKITKILECLPWPTQPKFIYTSNNFDTDEIFKIWTGMMIEKNVPYYTGQHGNNYGTHIWAGGPNFPERSATDKFFTWGWTNENTNNIPAFNFKIVGKKYSHYDSKGKLLLIEACEPNFVTPWDEHFEHKIYQDLQFDFVAKLSSSIRSELIVRLCTSYKQRRWSEELRWKNKYPEMQLETSSIKMENLIKKSRIVVHSYDSTGILETLALNIPTLCFWNGGFEHLLPEAKYYYEPLKQVGIYSETPEILAKTISLHWDDVEKWWNSDSIQKTREIFCSQYSKVIQNPIKTMTKLLTQQTI